MFLAEQDHFRHHGVEEGRAEGARPAYVGPRIIPGADQVEVAAAVDLAAAEEKGVEPALSRQVKQLGAAIGEGVAAQDTEHPDPGIARARQHRSGTGDRRQHADRDVAAACQQPRDGRDQKLLATALHRAIGRPKLSRHDRGTAPDIGRNPPLSGRV